MYFPPCIGGASNTCATEGALGAIAEISPRDSLGQWANPTHGIVVIATQVTREEIQMLVLHQHGERYKIVFKALLLQSSVRLLP